MITPVTSWQTDSSRNSYKESTVSKKRKLPSPQKGIKRLQHEIERLQNGDDCLHCML